MLLSRVSHSLTLLSFLLADTSQAQQYCDSPSPAFNIPDLSSHTRASALHHAVKSISKAVSSIIANDNYDTTSFSFAVTSLTDTLHEHHHTARERSTLRRGAEVIGNSTNYRIASMTKPFTVLAILQQQKAGKLHLDDSILRFLPELNGSAVGNGSLPWKDITIRALTSQIAGIPRDLAEGDLINDPALAASIGLPVLDRATEDLELPTCDEMVNYTRACDAADAFAWVRQLRPVYAPNQRSTYSNINYILLGLVVANVTGMSYDDYVTKHILEEVGMTGGTSFHTPPDDVAAIPKGIEYYWDFEIGVQNPTGGLYSNTRDMSVWLRYVLGTYNAQARGVNWFQPGSWSGSVASFYGLPWETYRVRTRELLGREDDEGASTRPVTLVTKGGGLPGYTSEVVMIPEYGLGFTFLVAGEGDLLDEVKEIVVKHMVEFAERVAISELDRYKGSYFEDDEGFSKIEFDVSERDGLYITNWRSNGKDIAKSSELLLKKTGDKGVGHVVPTLLFIDEKGQKGERWRIEQRVQRSKSSKKASVWDNLCETDIDAGMYAGKPVFEIVFWGAEDGGVAQEVELTGFRKTLRRVKTSMDGSTRHGEQRVLMDV